MAKSKNTMFTSSNKNGAPLEGMRGGQCKSCGAVTPHNHANGAGTKGRTDHKVVVEERYKKSE